MSERSSGPAAVGVIDPSIDPVENFREHISFGSGDIWAVWLPEHPLTAGEHPRPDHAVLVCITGNGPTSEANARFIAECFSAAPLAQQAAGSTGGAPTRDELAKIISKRMGGVLGITRELAFELADAILARWPAASRVPSATEESAHG